MKGSIMNRVVLAAILTIACISTSVAQQQSPLNDRIALQIGQLVIQVNDLSLQNEQLRQQVQTLVAENKALKDKYETKPQEPPK